MKPKSYQHTLSVDHANTDNFETPLSFKSNRTLQVHESVTIPFAKE